MSRRRWAAAATLAVLIQAPQGAAQEAQPETPPPTLQGTPEEVVEQQFRAFARAAVDWTLEHTMRGELAHEARNVQTVRLTQGVGYAAAAACDNDCHDLDLWVRGADGAVVGEDTLPDSEPVAKFVAPSSGEYRIEVQMVTCIKSPCRYGMELYRDK